METALTFLIYTIVLLAVSMVGAYAPFIKKLSDNQIHLLIAISAGIFLGILFFLLIPEAVEKCEEGDISERALASAMLAGFLLILIIDVLIKHFHMEKCPCECHEDQHRHKIGSLSAFIGLSVHAFIDGLVLAATLLADPNIGWLALLGMCIHKFVELFSLSSTFLLTDERKSKIIRYLFMFAIITPIGAVISFLVLNGGDPNPSVTGLPLAFSAGTLMYVAICDMLPEAFHRKNQDIRSFVFIAVGIAIAAVVFLLIPHMD